MNDLDWLRLGGLVAHRWSEIDFAEVDIRRVDEATIERYAYHFPVLPEKTRCFAEDDAFAGTELEYETIEMEKAVIEGHSVRIGYGPLSKTLLVSMAHCPI